MQRTKLLSLLVLAATIAGADSASAMHHVTFERGGKQCQISGRLVVEAEDGGLFMQSRDGTLWAIPPEEQVRHTKDDAAFEPFTREEMKKHLLAQLSQGFDVFPTAHYLIFYNTSKTYGQWCGSLFERLHMAFTNYWSRKGFKLREPEFPLVAIVFADRDSYLRYAAPTLGDAAKTMVGYYNLLDNRMALYDLTGVGRQVHSSAQINQLLARPGALHQVATIVHEATHQIAYNCGLHTRFSDCPLWFAEGIAVFFETPDLSSKRGWRGMGEINRPRLVQFQRYLRSRPANSLETLVRDAKRLRDPRQAADAYAEAWALTYFLIRTHPEQYVAYLKLLSTKKPLIDEGPKARLEEFENAFGKLDRLDAEFLRYMSRFR